MRVMDVEYGYVELVSSDSRRDIYEFNFDDAAFQYFVVKDTSKPLGNHFHKKKFEIFYFIAGGGTYQTARVNKAGEIVGEIRQFRIERGAIIRVPPYHTHRFNPDMDTQFVGFSSKPYDKDDIIPCPIE